MTEKKQDEKTKVTFYFSQEGVQMLNEIYSGRLLAGIKVDRSRVAFDALALLHAKEVRRAPKGNEEVTTDRLHTAAKEQGVVKKPQTRKKPAKNDEE